MSEAFLYPALLRIGLLCADLTVDITKHMSDVTSLLLSTCGGFQGR